MLPMKHQPQLMCWIQYTGTVHSGISQSKERKTYHLYIS